MYYKNLSEYVKMRLESFSSSVALNYEEQQISFAALLTLANQFRSFIRNKGLTSGDVVGIVNEKSKFSYALMLAAIQEGVAYVNIDAASPETRFRAILETCDPKLVYFDVQDPTLEKVASELQIVCSDSTVNLPAYQEHAAQAFDGSTIAYIMFTSGSTGVPKGVAITHQNILHFIHWVQSRYEISIADNFANHSPMYFDNSVFDFYGGLFNGASLTPISRQLLQNPLRLVQHVTQFECTIWFSVPSLLIFLMNMKVLTKDYLQHIRIFTFGGEGYPKKELQKLYHTYCEGAKFINVYGPTEGTCICSSYDITEKDFEEFDELPSLGAINPNFSYVILNEDGNIDKEGELCIMGPNIGLGYFNNPKMTSTSFTTCQFDKHHLKPMYKTGDIVKEIEGLLYFKGRKDNQIKHMGYRIELEEIEIGLSKLNYVIQAATLYKRETTSYGKIYAYVSLSEKIEQERIKKDVARFLPAYMVPNIITIMTDLPKNANGKVDRKALKNL